MTERAGSPDPTGSDVDRAELARLTAQLSSPRERERATAARALAAFGTSAVDPLGASFQDSSQRIRVSAAGAPGVIADPRAVPALRKALGASLDRTASGTAVGA